MNKSPKWSIEFYEDARGRRPATDFLNALDPKDRARITRAVALLESCGKIFELRIAAGRRDYRILYAPIRGQRFILLHAFAKTTNKTPERELEIAERRWADHSMRKERKAE